MKLATGTHLGPYVVLSPLGAGGMGEVYRARDTRLERDVALKVLPEAFASDPARLARFQREARLLAALTHPNVAVVHEVGAARADESGPQVHYLAMELLLGETLADRLARGPLAPDETLRVGAPIAAALAAAHEKGIVHRDLKPSNVSLGPHGEVKVLDFGLATMAAPEPSSGDSSEDETLTRGLTAVGAVVGTPPYMSPEQARGKPVDARTDVWAFGCVVYEMLTGRRAFEGETATDTVVAIVDHEPEWDRLPRHVPSGLRRLMRACLEKDAQKRILSAASLRSELERLRDAKESGGRGPVAWLAAAGVIGALVLTWVLSRTQRERTAGTADVPASRRLAQVTFAPELDQWPAWSPDGSHIAYASERDGHAQLFVRDVATGEERRLTRGGHDDIQPAWSPEGKRLAFVRSSSPGGALQPSDVLSGSYQGGDVWVLDLDSGSESLVVKEAFHPAFSPDGSQLAVDASWAGPRRIWTTDSGGRNPRQVTTDTSEAIAHTDPSWSPDGGHVVFQQEEKTRLDVRVVEVASGEVRSVTDDLYRDLAPVWSPTGRHVYFSSYRGGGLNIWRVPVGPEGVPTALPEQLTTGAGQDLQPSVDALGQRLVFTVLSENSDLWRLPVDPATGSPTGEPEPLVVSSREDSRGSWSPDGSRVAFNSDRDGDMNIWVSDLADGAARPVTRGPGGDYQPRWSPDGTTLAFFSARAGSIDIWTVDLASGSLTRVTDDPGLDTNPFFSPDGRTLAFESDRDGRKEVWIVPAVGGAPRQLSRIGASDHFLRFSDDGAFVYFRSTAADVNGVHRVPVAGGPAQPLGIPAGWHMSFSPDRSLLLDAVGHRALVIFSLDGSSSREVFAPDDPGGRIDYPEWSPDGRFVVFDRVTPRGGDLWSIEGLE